MRHNNWPIAARLMEHWFSEKAYEYPNPKDVNYAEIPHNDQIVTLKWALGFERAKKVYDEMWKDGIYVNPIHGHPFYGDPIYVDPIYVNHKAREEIEDKLGKQNKFTDKKEAFGDLSQPVAVINENYYYQQRGVEHSFLQDILLQDFDDMFVALHNFEFRMAFQGEVVPKKQGVYRIHLRKVGIYLRDSFSFENDQPLGVWDPDDNSASRTPGTGHGVRNRDFREWRKATGCGGDFIVFSDLKIRDVDESWEIKR